MLLESEQKLENPFLCLLVAGNSLPGRDTQALKLVKQILLDCQSICFEHNAAVIGHRFLLSEGMHAFKCPFLQLAQRGSSSCLNEEWLTLFAMQLANTLTMWSIRQYHAVMGGKQCWVGVHWCYGLRCVRYIPFHRLIHLSETLAELEGGFLEKFSILPAQTLDNCNEWDGTRKEKQKRVARMSKFNSLLFGKIGRDLCTRV